MALALAALLLAGCDDPFGSDGDRSPPELSLSAPAAGEAVESDSLVVEGTATDRRRVERVAFRLNRGAEQPVEITPGKTATFRFVLRDLLLGANEVEVIAYDASERSASRRVAFSTRDVTAPVLQVLTPVEGELAPRDSVRVTGTARDERQVAALFYALDGGAEQAVPVAAGREAGFAFTIRGTAPGEHTLVLRARDAGGNDTRQTLRFTTSAAVVNLRTPARDTALTHFVLVVDGVIESSVPVARATFAIDGGQEATSRFYAARLSPVQGTPGTYEITLPVDGLPHGQSRVTVFLYDAQGKRIGKVERTVTVTVPVKRYTATFLGTLGGNDSQGRELNEKNQVVGWALTEAGVKHAFFWEAGQMRDLGRGLGGPSEAVAINAGGKVVGTYTTDCLHSFTWTAGAAGEPGEVWPGCEYRAMDVNDAGKVLLTLVNGTGGALLEGSTLRPMMRGNQYISYVTLLNNRDQVVAYMSHPWQQYPAWVSPDAPPVQITHIPGVVDINDAGHALIQCAGKTTTIGPDCEPQVAGLPGSSIRSIGYPRGFGIAWADALNDRDQVAGTYLWAMNSRGTERRPFLWENGTSYDVQIDGGEWVIEGVNDLNDAGVILAFGRNTRTGRQGAVLLTPRG